MRFELCKKRMRIFNNPNSEFKTWSSLSTNLNNRKTLPLPLLDPFDAFHTHIYTHTSLVSPGWSAKRTHCVFSFSRSFWPGWLLSGNVVGYPEATSTHPSGSHSAVSHVLLKLIMLDTVASDNGINYRIYQTCL